MHEPTEESGRMVTVTTTNQGYKQNKELGRMETVNTNLGHKHNKELGRMETVTTTNQGFKQNTQGSIEVYVYTLHAIN